MLNEFPLYTLSCNCAPSSVCTEFLKKLLGGNGGKNKTISKKSCAVLMGWKAILLIAYRMHSRFLRAKRLQGLLGWTENYSAFSCPCITLTDGSLRAPRALAGIRIWCIPLQGVLLVGLWSEFSLCCWKEIFHLSRFKTEMVSSRLLPQDLSPFPFLQQKTNKSKWPAKLCFVSTD